MSKQRIGTVAKAAGAALKEALGKVTGNRGLEAEGAAEKAALRARPAVAGRRAGG
ncbi:CsbD family protein [Lichenibacterium minor]|uniref:CsbD family protein n=1 Tax=Lichenibacterium minor TaxID=2316528 RepID=A0A4Q2U5L6_9HYPH|nr:CsbD family protein [Lichenibacterium minor]RYC31879.1 CsbD family protein [Lichenibacterium minor]